MKLLAIALFIILFSYIKHTSDQAQYYAFYDKIYRITVSTSNVQNFSSHFQYLIISDQKTFSYKNYYYSFLDALRISNFEILNVVAYPQIGEFFYLIDIKRNPCPQNKAIFADASNRIIKCSKDHSLTGKDGFINLHVAIENFDFTLACKNDSPKCSISTISYNKSKLITEAINCESLVNDTKPLLLELYLSSQDLHSYFLERIRSCYPNDIAFKEKLNLLIDFKVKKQTYRF